MEGKKDIDMDQIKVGKFIQECRKAQDMTQSDLASALHVTDQAVSKWERGLNYPDITLLFDLALVLQVSVTEILLGEHTMSEIKTDEAVKEVLDYSSTLIKNERNLFSKERMLLRLVIALAVAALINAYFR
jgi:transcriptional regulator with XRE-family HTH domain